MTEKLFIDATSLLGDSFELGIKIYESGFIPTFIIGIWRGGAPIGVTVQELLDYCGCKTDHIAIRTSSYAGIERREHKIHVHGLSYLVNNLNASDSLLIIDDVHDSGLSIQEVITQIKKKCRNNTPRAIRTAALYYKPGNNKVDFKPDYFIHQTDRWLVFPHELEGLTRKELLETKPGIEPIREWLLKHFPDQ